MTNCPSTPKPFRADGGDISTGRLKEIADNPYGDEEKCCLAGQIVSLLAHNIGDKFLAQKIWNACRTAMHLGAENTESRCTMQPASALDSLPSNADSRCSNSPVIPDGWKLVPIVPTEKMVIEGFESEPDEFFSKSEVWEAYQKMSGCEQAAHRAKLCWAAMISAAPQQEVKL